MSNPWDRKWNVINQRNTKQKLAKWEKLLVLAFCVVLIIWTLVSWYLYTVNVMNALPFMICSVGCFVVSFLLTYIKEK